MIDGNYDLVVRRNVNIPTGVLGSKGVLRGFVEGILFDALLHEPDYGSDYNNYK
jgi:hypothetical protein